MAIIASPWNANSSYGSIPAAAAAGKDSSFFLNSCRVLEWNAFDMQIKKN